jgi:hypothetical protein
MRKRDEIEKSTFSGCWLAAALLYFGIVIPTMWGLGFFDNLSWESFLGQLPMLVLILLGSVVFVVIVGYCDSVSRGDEFKDGSYYSE